MKNLRQIVCIILLLSGYAYGSFKGFYVGGGGGVAVQQVGLDVQARLRFVIDNPSFPTGQVSTVIDDAYGDANGQGELYGGWGLNYGWWYLGGRLGGNWSSYRLVEKSTQNNAFVIFGINDQLQNKASARLSSAEFFADLKPGWEWAPNRMLFGIVGVVVNQQHLEDFGNYQDFISGMGVSVSAKNRKTRAGLRLGLGLERRIFTYLALNVSYIYTLYPKITAKGLQTTASFPLGLETGTRANMRKGVGSVGVGYYF